MKTKLNFNLLFLNLLIVTFFVSSSSELLAQEKKASELTDFKIIVENTDKGIKLMCKEGCAWKELTYATKNYKPQAINEYGMTELDKNSSTKDSNLTDFLFTMIKTENGINLEGIEGTAWTDLSFSLQKNKSQAFNQFGMTN